MQTPPVKDNETDTSGSPAVVAYKRGIVDGYWEEYKPNYARNPFFTSWSETFVNLDVSLLVSDDGKHNANETGAADILIKTAPGDKSSWFAVTDTQNPHRVMIFQEVTTGLTDWSLIGGICYFDEQGKREFAVPLEAEWFRFDGRRPPHPSKKTLVLCGNIICYATSSGCMDDNTMLKGWILKEDKPVGEFSNLRMWYEGDKTRLGQLDPQQEIVNGRWFCYLCKARQIHFCVDLTSIRREPTTSSSTVGPTSVLYDTVSIPANKGLGVTMDALVDVPSYEITERDGYPLRCIACGGDVVDGHMYMYVNGSPFGLGLAACSTCLIRFSKFKGKWICWQMVPAATRTAQASSSSSSSSSDQGLDECVVNGPDYKCSVEHANVIMDIRTMPKKRGGAGQATIRVDVKKVKTDSKGSHHGSTSVVII
jgi:hypothetical protein